MRKRICRLYQEGYSLRKIARKEKRSPNTIKKYLIEEGIKVKRKNIINKLNSKNNYLIGLYAGLWAGDGTQYYDNGYRIKICCHSKDKELIIFIQDLLLKLFNKNSNVQYEIRNRALIRFNSKFIYDFIYDFLDRKENKTHSVCLKKDLTNYSDKFIKGFLLGLMLSDGHLNKKFQFNSTSKKLTKNLRQILKHLNINSKIKIYNRKKYGWKNLNSICLNKEKSIEVLKILNNILNKIEYAKGFKYLKGYEKI